MSTPTQPAYEPGSQEIRLAIRAWLDKPPGEAISPERLKAATQHVRVILTDLGLLHLLQAVTGAETL